MSSGHEDDFTQIKGIGAARMRWLQETFDVYTFEELAALSADAIAAQLKAEKKPITSGTIEEWIKEAGRLAAEPRDSISSTGNGVWNITATFIVTVENKNENGVRTWRMIAHHMETDDTIHWPGFELAQLTDWMMAQLDIPPQPFPLPEKAIEPVPEARLFISEEITPATEAAQPQPPPGVPDWLGKAEADLQPMNASGETAEPATLPEVETMPEAAHSVAVLTGAVPTAHSDKLRGIIAKIGQFQADASSSQLAKAEMPPTPAAHSDALKRVMEKARRLETQPKAARRTEQAAKPAQAAPQSHSSELERLLAKARRLEKR
jgi:hypothetical protein